MNQFPITNKRYDSYFSCYYKDSMLPEFNWGEKVYIEFSDKLCAAIPLYSAFVSDKDDDNRSKTLVCFNVAGLGKRLFEWRIYRGSYGFIFNDSSLKIFSSVEDYERYCDGEDVSLYVPDSGVEIEKLITTRGFCVGEADCWYRSIQGWAYLDNHPSRCALPFRDVWIDGDGWHITVIMEKSGESKRTAYLTREECLAASRKTITDFEENPEEEKEREFIVELPKSVSIRAKSQEEADAFVDETIRGILNR